MKKNFRDDLSDQKSVQENPSQNWPPSPSHQRKLNWISSHSLSLKLNFLKFPLSVQSTGWPRPRKLNRVTSHFGGVRWGENDTSFAAGLWRRRIRRGCPKLVSLEEIKLKIHFFARRFRGKRRRERCHSALFLFYSIMFKMTARACPRYTPNTIRYGIVCFGIASFIKKYFASFCTKNAQLFFCVILL